jgi:hypothetical protein
MGTRQCELKFAVVHVTMVRGLIVSYMPSARVNIFSQETAGLMSSTLRILG